MYIHTYVQLTKQEKDTYYMHEYVSILHKVKRSKNKQENKKNSAYGCKGSCCFQSLPGKMMIFIFMRVVNDLVSTYLNVRFYGAFYILCRILPLKKVWKNKAHIS